MGAVFYLKRLFGSFGNRRLELFGHSWINLGQPVVSYYTPSQLDPLLAEYSSATCVEKRLGRSKRFGRIIKRATCELILRKEA